MLLIFPRVSAPMNAHPWRSRWCRSLRRSDRQGAWSKDKRRLWTRNIAFVQSLAADQVIDYKSTNFMAGLHRFDVICDAVVKSSFVSCRPLLAPGGTYVTTLPTPSLFFWSGAQSIAVIFRNAKRAKGIMVRPSGKDLAYLCQLVDEGKLRPTISLTCSLERAAEAHEASEAGHTRGKIVFEL